MAAIISGSTLAMMFYDHSSGFGNKEGLLTGKVISHVHDTISDSQINNVKIETKVYIYGSNSMSRFEPLCDNKGQPDKVDKSVVGWFKYRHNTSHRLSMKEKSVHQSLLRNIPPDRRDNFLFILCTSKKSENVSTCNFDHTVFKYDTRERKFLPISLTVINLGDTTHTDYKCNKSCTVDYGSGTFGDLLSSFEHELLGPGKKSMEAGGVQKMAESLQTQLQCLTHGVLESDMEVHTLQAELEQMEMLLHRKMEKKRAMKPLPPSPMSDQPSTTATSKHEETKKPQACALYPNLSEMKKESSSGSRRRKLSDDNYSAEPGSNLHSQIEQKCHILDSPNETMEEEMGMLVGNSLQASVSSRDKSSVHHDIPFADSEGPDSMHAKNKSEVVVKSNQTIKTAKSSDPFSFVEGMLATSKSENDIVKRKVNAGKSQESKVVKGHEASRVTRSRNNQPDTQSINSQTGNQKMKNRSRSRSREKDMSQQIQREKKKAVLDLSSTGSDEDIFDEQEVGGDNQQPVIDLSSSPVF